MDKGKTCIGCQFLIKTYIYPKSTINFCFHNVLNFYIFQQKIKEVELSNKKLMTIPGDRETAKLKNMLKSQQTDLETKTRELSDCQDRILQMQKEVH